MCVCVCVCVCIYTYLYMGRCKNRVSRPSQGTVNGGAWGAVSKKI